MKVLHVLNTGKYSGAENVVITIINALRGDIECAYTSPDGPIRNILKEENIEFFPIPTLTVNAKALKEIINQYKPDIIHTHDYNAGVMACFTKTKIPIINHVHNNAPSLKNLCSKSLVYFSSCLKYKKILTVSESVMEEFIFGNFIKGKTTVVGNPLNLLEIREKAEEKGIIRDSSDVLFLGRLSRAKRPLFFLEIIAEITKDIPNLRVAMVGSGELREEVQNKIRELNLTNNVKLYGFQKNPYGLLKESKMMCMPSEWEGFGLAAVEGLALGKPVVASPVGGLKTIVNNQCGNLCESRDEYISELKKLLTDTLYYKEKSIEAKKRAEEYDNIEKYSQQIRKLYFSVFEF